MTPQTYTQRRNRLHSQIGDAILLLGLNFAPKNYPKNPYPFRQDSHFLYLVGANQPELAALIFPDGKSFLYGTEQTSTDIMWEGRHASLEELADAAGLDGTHPTTELAQDIAQLQRKEIRIHYLPPYRHDNQIWLSEMLHTPLACIRNGYSKEMAEAMVLLRIRKSESEIQEMERAIAVSKQMYEKAFKIAAPGLYEREVMGAMEGIARSLGTQNAFLPIVTTKGEVLHNNRYDNQLCNGDLLLIDTGVEVLPLCYGSDITRTIPVSGVFSEIQRDIYNVVLSAQQRAIAIASPTLSNKEVHLEAAHTIVDGLKELGFMKGDTQSAVEQGAHTLLFPHGIGHMLGLDSHDMEDLGDFVAYPKGEKPDASLGLANLRLGRKLEPGFVITVEPGIYFIPALIDQWMQQNKFPEYINYDKINNYRDFGGIRIEDDLLITEDGSRILGPPIPKSTDEIENRMKRE